MRNENFDAGCYSIAEIMKRDKQRKLNEEIGGFLMLICGLLLCYLLTACKHSLKYSFSVGLNNLVKKTLNFLTSIQRFVGWPR